MHRHDRGPRRPPHAALGLMVIAWGLLQTADNLNWIDAGKVFNYWPIALAALGSYMWSRATDPGSKASAGAILFVGVVLTMATLLGASVAFWKVAWPLLFVVAGASMVARSLSPRENADDPTAPQPSTFAFWSGNKHRVSSTSFTSADYTAFMGGIVLDLRGARIGGSAATIDLTVVMGGVQILVPPDWIVDNQITAIMAGVDDKSTGRPDATQRLILRGFVMMGGVEVKT